MAQRHHVAFNVPRATITDADVVPHFQRHGYRWTNKGENEWWFHRGDKHAALWRFDIRAYDTRLIVRGKPLADGTGTRVTVDYEIYTFMNLVFGGDIATLEAEARQLESALY